MNRIILGIDPGLNGALAAFDPDSGDITVHDLPTLALKRGGKNKRELDLVSLSRLLDQDAANIRHVFIELAASMPGQGVSGVFSFGKTYGGILGVIAGHFLPSTIVPPKIWKKALGVPASKDGARARASQLLPRASGNWPLVKHDGRAESAMLALYGARLIASATT